MAGEYEQYGLLQQIAGGGVDTAGQLLKQYREGVQFQVEQQAAEKRSKLQDIAIQQGQQQIQSEQLGLQQKQIEVERMLKDQPRWDANLTLQTQDIANKLSLQPIEFQHAVMKEVEGIQDIPLEEVTKHATAFAQAIEGAQGSQQDWQAFLNSDVGKMAVEEHPELNGPISDPKVQQTAKTVQAAALYTPQIQAAMINKQAAIESAQVVAGMRGQAQVEASRGRGVEAAGISAASREKVAQINADAKVQAATVKGAGKVTTADTKAGINLVYGRASTDFPGSSLEEIQGMGQQVALIGNSIMQAGAGKYTQAEAYEAAYSRVKGAFDASGGDPSVMNNILTTLGLGKPSKKAPSITQSVTQGAAQPTPSGTTSFTVRGKKYNIPNDKVDEFKKDMGIE